jgi:hypothetical protein
MYSIHLRWKNFRRSHAKLTWNTSAALALKLVASSVFANLVALVAAVSAVRQAVAQVFRVQALTVQARECLVLTAAVQLV